MLSWWKRRARLVEGGRELPSVGRLFTLSLPEAAAASPDAVGRSLMRFTEGPKPYAAVLVDLRGQEYLFSSGDLTGVVMAGLDADGRQFLPCAVVADGRAGDHLRELLRVSRLDRLDYLIVASTESEALQAIERYAAGPRGKA